MPNPNPTFFSTGNFESRAALRAAIHHKRRKGKYWNVIARETGVSHRTAKRCYLEEEAIRKEARARAYAASARPTKEHYDAAQQRGRAFAVSLIIYVVATVLVLAAAGLVAFFRA